MGGAKHVTAVDVSESAVEMARANAQRNGLSDVVDCVAANVFDLLPQLEKEPPKYDFIILDPPAFTKSRKTVANAITGYKEINYRAMRLLPRGGYLATCSCSHFATEEKFIAMLHMLYACHLNGVQQVAHGIIERGRAVSFGPQESGIEGDLGHSARMGQGPQLVVGKVARVRYSSPGTNSGTKTISRNTAIRPIR